MYPVPVPMPVPVLCMVLDLGSWDQGYLSKVLLRLQMIKNTKGKKFLRLART